MDPINPNDLAALINALRAEVQGLSSRLAALELASAAAAPKPAADPASLAQGADQPALPAFAAASPPATTHAAPVAAPPEASEEDLLVIAAAVAAYLGVRARIRQVRLIQSTAWAQVGRATVHASHRVH